MSTTGSTRSLPSSRSKLFSEKLTQAYIYSKSLTKDLLNNATFLAEQKTLWFANRSGLLSAAPRSLGIAAPSNVFTNTQLSALVAQSRANLTATAISFSNGNADLAKGIAAQLDHALSLYEQDKELPLEMNLGIYRFQRTFLHLPTSLSF